VCTAALHGNEPAGVEALKRVCRALGDRRDLIQGEFLGLAGNLPALARGERAIDRDLNRHWKPDRILTLRNGHPPDPAIREDRELVELLAAIEAALTRARGEAYFVDLHTTSGESAAFATVGDTLRNREFASQLHSPIILGLEEHIEGTLLEYLNGLGYITMGFEGGRHEDPSSVDLLEAGVWGTLAASGVLLDGHMVAELERSQRLLKQNRRGLPRVFEVRYRHPVHPEDRFRMHPGYASFQRLTKGELVAEDRSGEIRAPLPSSSFANSVRSGSRCHASCGTRGPSSSFACSRESAATRPKPTRSSSTCGWHGSSPSRCFTYWDIASRNKLGRCC
jgi:succinylglutamate desuccinylase